MKIIPKSNDWIYALLLYILSYPIFASSNTLLLRQPDIKGNTLVFTYGQEIWQADLNKLNAKRITSFQGQSSDPKLSPNGKWIAFTGQYNGNADVFIVPVNGGSPKQLTWHPGADRVKGWSSNGKYIIFSSGRDSVPWQRHSRFWQVKIEGSTPIPLPMMRAETGSMSPDGKKFIYQKVSPWDDGWRKYRGGQNNPLRILNLNSLKESKLPWHGEKITDPRWQGDSIYYLSDQDGVVNIYKYDQNTHNSKQITHHDDYDVKNYGVDDEQIIYEQQGQLFIIKQNKISRININIAADFPWSSSHWLDVSKEIESATISPTGQRALFVAHGEVFTVPAKDGDIRNISNTPTREISATWSHDGQRIAWFADQSGEYRIVISDQYGQKINEITLKEKGFYYDLAWSPDDNKLSFTDQKQRIWWLNVNKQRATLVDQNTSVIVEKLMAPVWSPDSKWLAYVKTESTFFRNVYIYSLKKNKSYVVTNNMADNLNVAWGINGKYLFFTASTDYASKAPWLDLSISGKKDESYSVYAALLSKEVKSPIGLKQQDEEPIKSDKEDKSAKNKSKTKKDDQNIKDIKIDIKTLSQRFVSIPIKPALISHLSSIENGIMYLVAGDQDFTLKKYGFEKQKEEKIIGNINEYQLASNGKAILVKQDDNWKLVSATEKLAKAKPIKLKLAIWTEPKKEWRQKFKEAWRYQRDFFYVKNIHGANWNKLYKDYLPLVESVNHPADLTYLLDQLGAETSVGHSFTRNGKLPDIPKTQVGLLGINIERHKNRYVISKIFRGEMWNSKLNQNAPFGKLLDEVQIGDSIVSVNGKKLTTTDNFYQAFNGTLNKQTHLAIAKQNNVKKIINVWVKPIRSESALRRFAWVEKNRRYVDKKSHGKLAYIWLPDTGEAGYEMFNRYYFAQANKQGVIIDERFNNGGAIADYFINILTRKLSGYFNNQFNPKKPLTSPGSIIDGPKVLLINEMAGSGGDLFPYLFRFHNIGKLVGKKTWGGLVGYWGVPSFIDGGAMTAPRSGFYDLNGQWKVENEGVAPDIEVDENIALAKKGIDAQLQKAVAVALQQLKAYKDIRQRVAPKSPNKAVIH